MIRFIDLAMVAPEREGIFLVSDNRTNFELAEMADKEGFADWKWLVDFHARALEGRGATSRERRSTRARHGGPYFLSPGARE